MNFWKFLTRTSKLQIDREYTHLVLVRSNGNTSLLEMDGMRALCDLESKLTAVNSYKEFCQMKIYSKECCRPWTIPNYIAFLANKTSCADIQVPLIMKSNRISNYNNEPILPCIFAPHRRTISSK